MIWASAHAVGLRRKRLLLPVFCKAIDFPMKGILGLPWKLFGDAEKHFCTS